MSKLYVRARYSKTGEETLEMTGNINPKTKTLTFVSDDKKSFKISNKFKRYHYQDRIILASDAGEIEEEWILTLIPTKKILETMEIKEMDIDEDEDEEEDDSSSEDESSSDEEEDESSGEEEEDYVPKKYIDDVEEEEEESLDEEEYSDDDEY